MAYDTEDLTISGTARATLLEDSAGNEAGNASCSCAWAGSVIGAKSGSRGDELHEAGDGNFLPQLALIGDQRRVFGAQRVIGVHVPMIEGIQHLPEPCVGAALQHLGLQHTEECTDLTLGLDKVRF